VVLAEALAVRGLGDVLHVQDLVLVPVAGLAVPELVLTRQMELSVITVVEVRLRCPVHAVTSVARPRDSLTLTALVISCAVTVVMKSASAPVLASLLIVVTPEVALGMVLTQRLAVTHSLEVGHLDDQILLVIGVTQQALDHITHREGGGSCASCSCSCSRSCGGGSS